MREWLLDARRECGLDTLEMAGRLDISESYYKEIEAGRRQQVMDVTLATALATILGMPLVRVAMLEFEARGALPEEGGAGEPPGARRTE